jgi:hypothetical protein
MERTRLLIAAVAIAVTVATSVTVPASADPYRVTVQLADGTVQLVVLDLPAGATLDDLAGHPEIPGTPVAIEALEREAPAEPGPIGDPPTDPPPPTEPPADDPSTGGPSDDSSAGSPATDETSASAPEAPSAEGPGGQGDPGQAAPGDLATEQLAPAPAPGAPQRLGSLERSQTDGEGDQAGPVEHKPDQRRRPSGGTRAPLRNPDGTPTTSNPGWMEVLPGPAVATRVPNFIIRKFRVPPFLLPIYQAAGIEYGIRWEVLAAINEIETDYGRNLTVSSAGAVGWMQFMPSTWAVYGVDANKDGRRDPYNPVDAIFAAARYLKAASYEQDVRMAIFAYNHADWYVDSVLLRARLIAGVPADLIGSLTGLTEGHFPVHARARYADDLAEAQLLRRVTRGQNAANIVESSDDRRSIDIFAGPGAPVVAVNDGEIRKIGRNRRLGRYLVLQDVYGNRYSYAQLGSLIKRDRGDRVLGGKVIGRVGATADGRAPHLDFAIRPAGRGAPKIDPKPILDGWKLLEATSIYRASGQNVLRQGASIGQVLLLPKPLLERRVLADERIEIYDCGRDDIRSGQIDRRVLAALAYLAESGLEPTVASLRCGHSYHTKNGNVSHHSYGAAVDVAKINGIPILGHQEPGGVTDQAVRRLLRLQGALAPDQIISLLELGGSTLAMADHADHIHVGFRPRGASGPDAKEIHSVLEPGQWTLLVERLGEIENPTVP